MIESASILELMGKLAGIGGLSLGIFLILFREVIRKNIFPNLTKAQAYKVIKLIIVLTFVIAIFGISTWAYVELAKKGDEQEYTGPTVEMLDGEITYRLSLLKPLIKGDKINDRIMSEVKSVFENTPPGSQNYMIGGSRGLHPELMHLNLSALFIELKKIVPSSRVSELDIALSSVNAFQQLIISKDTREVKLSESVIDDVPNFDRTDIELIENKIIISFERWLR